MIIVQLSGGLGNQLFQYASAYSLSQKNQAPLRLDTSIYVNKTGQRKFLLDKFQLDFETINLRLLKLVRSEKTKGITTLPWINVFHKTIADPVWEEIKFDTLEKKVYLKGYWIFPNYFISHLDFFREKFRLKEAYRTELFNNVKYFIVSRNCVSIHIRRGDYLAGGYNQMFCSLQPVYFQNAIRKMEEQLTNPVFLVFSDDVLWAKENISFPANTYFIADFGITEDYMEFDLMRCCNHNIISNSTFSWWAALLNENKYKHVIQPVWWYKIPKAQKLYNSRKFFHINEAVYLE